MGSLAAQVAHVQFLGLCAHTSAVSTWTGEYLRSVLVWAEHVDLSWATLSHTEQTHTALCARNLLLTTRQSQKLLTSPFFQQQLPALAPGSCHHTILATVIRNRLSSNAARITAIQMCCSSKHVLLDICVQRDEQEMWAVEELASMLSKEMMAGQVSKHVQARVELYKGAMHNVLVPDILKREALNSGLLKQGGLDSDIVKQETLDNQMIRQIFAHTKDPTPRNNLLAAALCACEKEPSRTLGILQKVEHDTCEWLVSSADILLSSLETARILARLCVHSPPILRAYLTKLTQRTTKCQRAMLCFDGMKEEDVDVEAGLLWSFWVILGVEMKGSIRDALEESRGGFEAMLEEEKESGRMVDGKAAVEFWTLFYTEVLA